MNLEEERVVAFVAWGVEHRELPEGQWWACQHPERGNPRNWTKSWRRVCLGCWIDFEACARRDDLDDGLCIKENGGGLTHVVVGDLDLTREWWFDLNLPETP